MTFLIKIDIFWSMDKSDYIFRQVKRAIHMYPNDMELGAYTRRLIAYEERESNRNKKIHIENYNDNN